MFRRKENQTEGALSGKWKKAKPVQYSTDEKYLLEAKSILQVDFQFLQRYHPKKQAQPRNQRTNLIETWNQSTAVTWSFIS